MPDGQFFVPQYIPQSVPPNGSETLFNSPNQIRQAPGFEQQSQSAKVAAQARKVKAVTNTIISNRQQLKAYLAKNNIQLFTSAVEFQRTGDFIQSSYLIFKQYQNYQESLANFLQRYPQLQEPVMLINQKLKPLQGYLQVESKPPIKQYPNLEDQISQSPVNSFT